MKMVLIGGNGSAHDNLLIYSNRKQDQVHDLFPDPFTQFVTFVSIPLSFFIHSFIPDKCSSIRPYPAAVIKRLIRMHVKEWCTKPCVLGSLGLILAGFGTLFIFFWEDIFQTQLSNVSMHPPLTRSPSKPTRLDRLGITSTIPSRSSPPI